LRARLVLFAYGSYTAANGKWKGEVTNEEHTPTYARDRLGAQGRHHRVTEPIPTAAEADALRLRAKQSIRFKSRLRLLIPRTEAMQTDLQDRDRERHGTGPA